MTLIVTTLCPEGIALAADSKCTVSRCWMDSEAREVKREISGFVTNSQKMVLTDNNVGIAFRGGMNMKGRPKALFLGDYFKAHTGLNARQVAEEIGRLYHEDASVGDSEALVAGYMPGRGCRKPCVFDVTSEQPDRVRRMRKPGITWAGQSDVVDRIFDKGMTIRDGRKKVQIPEYPFLFAGFSLQDAVDLSVLCVELTYRTMRFQDREQTVGPPIDVLVITQDGGRWFRKRDIVV